VKNPWRDDKKQEAQREAANAESKKRVTELLNRRSDNRAKLQRQAITEDFMIRMRNQLALELLDDENVIEDESVYISRGGQLGVGAAGSALPELGVVIATSHRIRFAAVDDPAAVDAPLDTVRITHDEEGLLTFTWQTDTGEREAATLQFESPRTGLIKQLRRLILEANRKVESGPATPRVTTWDRLTRQRRR